MSTSDFTIPSSAEPGHPPVESPSVPPLVVELPVKEVETPDPKARDTSGIDITLFSNYVRVKTASGTYRYFEYRDFLREVKSAIEADNDKVAGGLRKFKLPKNVFAMEIGPARINISMYYPEQVRRIIYGSNGADRVCPNTIISAILQLTPDRTWAVSDPRFYCTAHPLESLPRTYVTGCSAGAGIYPLAFSNMYHDGRMCTGENAVVRSLPEEDLRGLAALSEMAFNSPFNRDLGVRAVPSYNSDPAKWFALLAEKAAKGEGFPYNLLGN